MTATIAAPQGFETFPGSTTAAFVGEDDAVTQRVAGVLNRHRYQVVHHRSPAELIENLDDRRPGAASAVRGRKRRVPVQRSKVGESERPVLYVFNCRVPGLDNTVPVGAGAWLDALKAVSTRAPGTAILVVVGPGHDAGLIKDAIQAGADEILSAGDTEIEELVWIRVQSALARAEAGPDGAASPAAGAPAGERRVGERRRGERRGGGMGAGPSATSQASDIVETWDEPASADEVRAAHDRVRAVLEHLPTAGERQGPLADLLGVTVPALRGESGRLDARKIAGQLGVPLARIARITPISRQALNETPDSVRAQAALDPLARVLDVLGTVLQPGQVRAWLNAPHARLGGEPPIRALLDGRAEQVARMLEAARDGGVG